MPTIKSRLEPILSQTAPKQARITLAAEFPMKSFLENLLIREDHSVLVSKMLEGELWYVPPIDGALPVTPNLLHKFEQPTMALVELEPDVICLATSNLYTDHESHLHLLDFRGWTPGEPVRIQTILTMPAECLSLNGACLVAPDVLLLADCFGGAVWRVDLVRGGQATVREWLRHPSMNSDPHGPDWTQPGVNGLKYHAVEQRLYYTSTAKQIFMRVGVSAETQEAIGEPEFVAGGRMADDFIIDPQAGVAFLSTHRQNTIDRVFLDPKRNLDFARNSVASHPPQEMLVGPSAGAWGRGSADMGRIAYFLTDGGTKSPPEEGPQTAKLLRVEFAPA